MSGDANPDKKSRIFGLELKLDTAIDGLLKSLPANVTSLPLRGVSTSIPDVIKQVETTEKPWKDVRAFRAAISTILVNRPADKASALELLNDIQVGLASQVGSESPVLVACGFTPRKKRPKLSSEKKVLAAAKAKLTRQKRGTLGRRQKEAIRVTGTPQVTIGPEGTTVVPPATEVPVAPPAPPAPPPPVAVKSS